MTLLLAFLIVIAFLVLATAALLGFPTRTLRQSAAHGVNLLLEALQRDCPHDPRYVSADILEGCGGDTAVKRVPALRGDQGYLRDRLAKGCLRDMARTTGVVDQRHGHSHAGAPEAGEWGGGGLITIYQGTDGMTAPVAHQSDSLDAPHTSTGKKIHINTFFATEAEAWASIIRSVNAGVKLAANAVTRARDDLARQETHAADMVVEYSSAHKNYERWKEELTA